MKTQGRLQNPGCRCKKIPTFCDATALIQEFTPAPLRCCAQKGLRKGAGAALLLCTVVCGPSAQGQAVLAPPPAYSATPPAMQEFRTNRLGAVQPPPSAPEAAPERPLLEWGPLSLRPRLMYRFEYGNGIQSMPGEQEKTAIHEVSPGLLLGLGRHFTLDYTPTWRFYSNNKFRDTLDHNVLLTGGTTYEDWVLGLSQSYSSVSLPMVETGTQTSEESYHTSLTASYRFNSKMSADLALDQTIASAEEFSSYREWVTMNWLNYQVWTRLDAGIGVGFGYDDVEASPDMTFERLQGRIIWRATDKTSFLVRGGLEDRQFLSGGEEDLINPIAGASIDYRPFEATALSLNVDRTVNVSYFAEQITETTSFSANLSQRLLKKFYVAAGGGYAKNEYVASTTEAFTSRDDDYYFLNLRLSWAIRKRATLAVFYMYSDNSSSEPGFDFSSNQVGFELGYRY